MAMLTLLSMLLSMAMTAAASTHSGSIAISEDGTQMLINKPNNGVILLDGVDIVNEVATVKDAASKNVVDIEAEVDARFALETRVHNISTAVAAAAAANKKTLTTTVTNVGANKVLLDTTVTKVDKNIVDIHSNTEAIATLAGADKNAVNDKIEKAAKTIQGLSDQLEAALKVNQALNESLLSIVSPTCKADDGSQVPIGTKIVGNGCLPGCSKADPCETEYLTTMNGNDVENCVSDGGLIVSTYGFLKIDGTPRNKNERYTNGYTPNAGRSYIMHKGHKCTGKPIAFGGHVLIRDGGSIGDVLRACDDRRVWGCECAHFKLGEGWMIFQEDGISSSLEGQHYYSFKIEKRDQDPTSIINHNIHRGPLDDETYERYVRSDPCTDFQSASEVNWSPGAMLWASSRGDCFQNDQIKADPTGQNYQFGYFKMCDGEILGRLNGQTNNYRQYMNTNGFNGNCYAEVKGITAAKLACSKHDDCHGIQSTAGNEPGPASNWENVKWCLQKGAIGSHGKKWGMTDGGNYVMFVSQRRSVAEFLHACSTTKDCKCVQLSLDSGNVQLRSGKVIGSNGPRWMAFGQTDTRANGRSMRSMNSGGKQCVRDQATLLAKWELYSEKLSEWNGALRQRGNQGTNGRCTGYGGCLENTGGYLPTVCTPGCGP